MLLRNITDPWHIGKNRFASSDSLKNTSIGRSRVNCASRSTVITMKYKHECIENEH